MKKLTLMMCLVFLIFGNTIWSNVIYVPDDFSTIQAAVDASGDGDTILVGPGIYYENIQINKELTFWSTHGSDSTTIDGSGNDGFYIEDNNPGEIKGFTILNCDNGIKIIRSWNYTISNSIILNNNIAIHSTRETELKLNNCLIINKVPSQIQWVNWDIIILKKFI